MWTTAACSPAHAIPAGEAQPLGSAPITTTLYDLMSALQEAAGTEADTLVVAAMVDLMRSGRLLWHSTPTTRQWAAHLSIQEA